MTVLVRNFPRQSPLSANPLQYDVPAFCEVWNRLGFRSWDAGIVVLRFRPRCHYALAMMIFSTVKFHALRTIDETCGVKDLPVFIACFQ